MNAFHWDDCFITGQDKVDEQHQVLVSIMNRLGDLLMQPHGASKKDVDRVFGELADYSKFHFAEEEATMHAAGLDSRHIKHHCDAHAQFLEDVTYMHAGTEHTNRESASNLLTYLANWLAYHILGTDQNMARLLIAVKEGTSQRDAYLAEQKSQDPVTATLLRSLTALFDHVSERNRALVDLNKSLESRIESRTSELVDMNHLLENMAMTDVLTELPNRRHAMRCLEQYWELSIKNGTPLACMMIDADGFKDINDSYGHKAGDDVLRELARCLRNCVRSDDVVCRLGGDEFLILCNYTTLEGAMKIAEKLRRVVSDLRVPVGSGIWHGSVSVGVAGRANTMQAIDDLLKLADNAVYVAKRNGRNCVETVQGNVIINPCQATDKNPAA